MKKFLALTFAFVLLGGIVSEIVLASRNAYHRYVRSQAREVVAVKPQTSSFTPSQIHPSRRVRTGPLRRSYVQATELSDRFTEYVTYENNSFSLEIPVEWYPEYHTSHTFVSDLDSFMARVKVFDPIVCGSATSFYACASNLSESENYLTLSRRGKLHVTSPITRMSKHQHTILHSRLQTQTYTESFMAKEYGTKFYLSRYFVRGLDGKVYMVETQSDGDRINEFVGVSKVIFDSFRVYEHQPL